MRRVSLIFGILFVTAAMAWEVYDFVVKNRGIEYFASQPHRLVYVALIGLIGGIFALAFSRLSSPARRTVKLISLGAFASCIAAVFVAAINMLPKLSSNITETGMWGWVIAALVALPLIVIILFLEFRSIWKTPAAVAN